MELIGFYFLKVSLCIFSFCSNLLLDFCLLRFILFGQVKREIRGGHIGVFFFIGGSWAGFVGT